MSRNRNFSEKSENQSAKKSLGQNFLKSESALKKIIEVGEIKPDEIILEIGPGRGALTEFLLNADAKIFAVEADFEMIKFLEEKFSTQIANGQLNLIRGDILKFDIENFAKKYKLIANIPYYITGEIIRKFLSTKNQPEKMVLLVQKEVADRIIARPEKTGGVGKESILSISVKVYCEPEFIQTVKAGSFVPAPKVDSAIMAFNNISKTFFEKNNIGEEKFFEILHAGFAHKRKKLFSNLKEKLNLSTEKIQEVILKTNLDKNIRAENLSTEDWAKICKII